jgi:hypothetical protein
LERSLPQLPEEVSPGQHQAELVFRLPIHKHKLFKTSIALSRVRRARASERFCRNVDWILPGEGKWLRPASGRCAPWLVTGREEGVNGNRNQQNSLSTMEPGKVEIGTEILLRISRKFGNSIE